MHWLPPELQSDPGLRDQPSDHTHRVHVAPDQPLAPRPPSAKHPWLVPSDLVKGGPRPSGPVPGRMPGWSPRTRSPRAGSSTSAASNSGGSRTGLRRPDAPRTAGTARIHPFVGNHEGGSNPGSPRRLIGLKHHRPGLELDHTPDGPGTQTPWQRWRLGTRSDRRNG